MLWLCFIMSFIDNNFAVLPLSNECGIIVWRRHLRAYFYSCGHFCGRYVTLSQKSCCRCSDMTDQYGGGCRVCNES